MDGLINVDRLLYRLLHRRSAREALRRGSLPMSDEERDAVACLDLDELERVAASVREDVLQRAHRGCGGLRELFPRTLASWREAHPEDADLHELAAAFLESDAYERYRELPFGPPACSLEEAFFRFAEEAGVGAPAVREDEYLAAVVRALALSPTPSFSVPPEVRRVPGGHAAVSTRGSPVLHAATSGRLIRGAVTPFLADLVRGASAPDAVARAHGVTTAVLESTLRELVALGLASRDSIFS